MKGMLGFKFKSLDTFFLHVSKDVIEGLTKDEIEAGQFFCAVLQGDIPAALEDLGEDIFKEIEDSYIVIKTFILSVPQLAPEILENILQDGEDVVTVVEEIFTNPKAAVTLIEGDVKTVISDIKSVWSEFTCIFKKCHSTDLANELNSSCGVVMAAATTGPASNSAAWASLNSALASSTAAPSSGSPPPQSTGSQYSTAAAESYVMKVWSIFVVGLAIAMLVL